MDLVNRIFLLHLNQLVKVFIDDIFGQPCRTWKFSRYLIYSRVIIPFQRDSRERFKKVLPSIISDIPSSNREILIWKKKQEIQQILKRNRIVIWIYTFLRH